MQSNTLLAISNPSALVSFQLKDKNISTLTGLERFKNLVISTQTELDISGNHLPTELPELFSLRFLKRLYLSHNQLHSQPSLPKTLEVLYLSGNFLHSLNLDNFSKLHTLDLTNNKISDLNCLSNLRGLKCLYTGWNQISSLNGIEKLNSLLELEVDGNEIRSREDILALNVLGNLVVVNLSRNRVVEQIRRFYTEEVEEFPCGYTELSHGVFYRNSEKLKEINTSRYKSIIRDHKDSKKLEKLIYIPEQDSDEEFWIDEEVPQNKLVLPISKIQLEQIGEKQEGWTTNPKSNIASMLDELIAYCGLEEMVGETYEDAIGCLKQREDERKKLCEKLEKAYSKNEKLVLELEEQKKEFQELSFSTEFEESLINTYKEEINEAYSYRDQLLEELELKSEVLDTEKFNDMESRIPTPLNLNTSFDALSSRYSPIHDFSINSTFLRKISNSEFLVNKPIGEYIEKLLQKISRYAAKIKSLREERNKMKLAYDSLKSKLGEA